MIRCIKNSIILSALMSIMIIFATPSYAKRYDDGLTKSQRESLCTQLKDQSRSAGSYGSDILGGGVIPDNVLTSIFSTTKKISDSTLSLTQVISISPQTYARPSLSHRTLYGDPR